MSFKKGNQLGGRKNGSVGKSNLAVKTAFADLLNNNLQKLQSDIDKLQPKDRLKIILDLAGFVIPKQKAIEQSVEVKQAVIPTINFVGIE